VAIATYEAETNVVIHSGSPGNIYCFIYPEYIRVRVEDHGKGIEDLDKAMQEGYSTATDQIREMGFGAGMGISNMHRYSDKMVIVSEIGKGVIVEMQFFLKESLKNT
jgi:anti-sigma regulatory factor (Ser/Thr protein kinase)